jgi:hypothetical protein
MLPCWHSLHACGCAVAKLMLCQHAGLSVDDDGILECLHLLTEALSISGKRAEPGMPCTWTVQGLLEQSQATVASLAPVLVDVLATCASSPVACTAAEALRQLRTVSNSRAAVQAGVLLS